MSGAPEMKYTDRDVRENEELFERAIEYVQEYTGEFEYLIDMKMRVASGVDLTTPMIRGILNCMRHDPRVLDLPVPLPPQEATVTELRPKRRRNKWGSIEQQCENTESHYAHSWMNEEFDSWIRCEGVPYLINRESFAVNLLIKCRYAVAKSGKLVHVVDLETGLHNAQWFPNRHEWGWWRQPLLKVKLLCQYPSWLSDPFLLNEMPTTHNLRMIKMCPHCEVVRDDRA